MKVECNYCGKVTYGNVPELIELGWNRAIFRKPFRKTFTSCNSKSCIEKMTNELDIIFKKNKIIG
jgi:hypothetical protein